MNKRKVKYQQSKNEINMPTLLFTARKNIIILYIIIAFCVPVLLYVQTLSFGFTNFDDHLLISQNIAFLNHMKNTLHAFQTDAFIVHTSPFYRPMQTVSYMADVLLSGGNNTWMFHLSNILLAGIISVLLFLLLIRFAIERKLALFAVLIYCTHPLFVSSIAWIPARGDLLLLLFSLLSFLFFIDFLQTRKLIYIILNWLTFTLDLFCKETAAFLPVLFIIYYFTFPPEKYFEKKNIIIVFLYAISGICWYFLRSKAIGNISDTSANLGVASILSNLRTIPESVAKFFIPADITPLPAFSTFKTLAGVGLIALLIFFFFRNKVRSAKERIFCLSWFLILMLPPMIYKHPFLDYLDHRFFLPMIGILLFLLFLFPADWFEKGKFKRYGLLLAVIIILCPFSFIKARSYADPMTFYNSAVAHNTDCVLAYYNRGNVKRNSNDIQGAIADYNKAIALCPASSEAYNNRGLAKAKMGDNKGAIADYAVAISLDPKFNDAWFNKGEADIKTGDFNDALLDFKKIISFSPDNAETYYHMGYVNIHLNNFKDAIDDFTKTLSLNPDNAEAFGNRAFAKYSLKDLSGAIDDCDNALKLNHSYEKALKLKTKIQSEQQTINN